MLTKTISIKNLLSEINQLGFGQDDLVLLLADAQAITLKKIAPFSRLTEFAGPA